jgi:hypothetical protein
MTRRYPAAVTSSSHEGPTKRVPIPDALMRADLRLRPATLDDAGFVADLLTAVHPDDPEDPLLMRHWWSVVDLGSTHERYVALRDGDPVGFAAMRHTSWDRTRKRFAGLQADLLPELRTAERLAGLLHAVERRAAEDGAHTITAWAWETDRLRIDVLRERGFREERRERFWELDLTANRERLLAMAEDSRRRMREAGIRLLTLDRDEDPARYRKLWGMSNEAGKDVPTTVPHTPWPFEKFERWLTSPGIREDRVWIARLDDAIVGVSILSYPPLRGVVVTEWTGTARSVRGRGVARALKCESVLQAISLGVPRVRTDNDGQNAPILHINATMGYERRADMIQFLKPLEA